MHEHTLELVTTLIIPDWMELRTCASSRDSPLNYIDIIDGDDYDGSEVVDKLRVAKQHPELRKLVLSEIDMDQNVLAALADLLRAERKWEAIHLSHCGGELEKAVEMLSRGNVCKLLEVAGNVDALCMDSLAQGLKANNSLKELSLFVNLDASNVGSLVDGLAYNTTVEKLMLTKSALKPDCIKTLAAFLQADQQLKSLHLDNCFIEDEDLAELVNALQNHCTLKELRLVGTFDKPDATFAICSLLQQNRLENLCVHRRRHLAEGKKLDTSWLVPALTINSSLTALDLSENNLDNHVLEQLSEALSVNSTLEEIRLHGNHITNQGVQSFASRIGEMKGLKKLYLQRNQLDEIGANYLLEGIHGNDVIQEVTISTTGRNKRMSKIQRMINYHTCLNSGGRYLLGDLQLPVSLWPLVFERSGARPWPQYCDCQNKSLDKWKRIQQADVIFHLLRGSALSTRGLNV